MVEGWPLPATGHDTAGAGCALGTVAVAVAAVVVTVPPVLVFTA